MTGLLSTGPAHCCFPLHAICRAFSFHLSSSFAYPTSKPKRFKKNARKLGASILRNRVFVFVFFCCLCDTCYPGLRRRQASSRRSSSVDPLTPTRSATPRAVNPFAHQVGDRKTKEKKGSENMYFLNRCFFFGFGSASVRFRFDSVRSGSVPFCAVIVRSMDVLCYTYQVWHLVRLCGPTQPTFIIPSAWVKTQICLPDIAVLEGGLTVLAREYRLELTLPGREACNMLHVVSRSLSPLQ